MERGCILWDRLKVLCHRDDQAFNDAGAEIPNTVQESGGFATHGAMSLAARVVLTGPYTAPRPAL